MVIAAMLGFAWASAGHADDGDRISKARLSLKSESPEVRLQGVKDLTSIHWGNDNPVYQDVLALLDDPDGRVRAYASRLTYLHQDPELGKPVVLALFNDPDPKVRGAALHVSENSWTKEPEFIKPLLKLTEDEDEINRWRALSCLNSRKAETDEMVPHLALRASSDAYWAARREAYQMLARLAPGNRDAAAALLTGLRDNQPDVVNFCSSELSKCGETAKSAIPIMASYLQNECFSCSYQGVGDALGEMGKDPALRPLVEAELVGYFASDDKYTIGSVCKIVEQFEPAGPEIKSAVLGLLKHELHNMRYQGAMLLCSIYTDDKGTVDPLAGLLSDQDKYVRYHATRALSARGELAKPAVSKLVDNLGNHFFHLVREASAEALGQIGECPPEVAAALTAAAGDADEAVAMQAIESLGLLGVKSAAANDRLQQLASSGDSKIKSRAQKMIEKGAGGK